MALSCHRILAFTPPSYARLRLHDRRPVQGRSTWLPESAGFFRQLKSAMNLVVKPGIFVGMFPMLCTPTRSIDVFRRGLSARVSARLFDSTAFRWAFLRPLFAGLPSNGLSSRVASLGEVPCEDARSQPIVGTGLQKHAQS